jgi:hypothetical protein
MKNIVLSFVFVFISILTAIHEVKHITNHDISSCQICIVDDNIISSDIIDKYIDEASPLHITIKPDKNLQFYFTKNIYTNYPNAPPILS